MTPMYTVVRKSADGTERTYDTEDAAKEYQNMDGLVSVTLKFVPGPEVKIVIPEPDMTFRPAAQPTPPKVG